LCQQSYFLPPHPLKELFIKENMPLKKEDIPPYLKFENGRVVIDENFIHEGSSGPFTFLSDYGKNLEYLKESTEVDYLPQGIEIHARTKTKVRTASDNLTRLANLGIDFNIPAFGVLYAANFTLAFIPPFEAAISKAGNRWSLLAPLRGGEPIHIIAKAKGYKHNIPRFRASRVILLNGEYLVGIQELDSDIKLENVLLLCDDCLAAAGSADTTVRWACQINPNIREIYGVVGVGVKRSTETLSVTWKRNKLNSSFEMGADANTMDDNYYLRVTEEEKGSRFPEHCTYRVGDMGQAMNLTDARRRNVLEPVIRAVANPGIDPQLIFEATSRVVKNPLSLHLWADKIFTKAQLALAQQC